jgi:hypothetical protein
VKWDVGFATEFKPEFDALPAEVQDKILALAIVLEDYGPLARRPYVDTLNGSRYPNMKEGRLSAADGEWRVALAFDPLRNAVLLVAGDKSGVSQRQFYRQLIEKADRRFAAHLASLG